MVSASTQHNATLCRVNPRRKTGAIRPSVAERKNSGSNPVCSLLAYISNAATQTPFIFFVRNLIGKIIGSRSSHAFYIFRTKMEAL